MECEYEWPMPPLLWGRCGLGDRKVRSVMEPELVRRCSVGRSSGTADDALELTDALRRSVRFVSTLATLIGARGCALSAAAAAEADGDGFLNTAEAAEAAFACAVEDVRGCMADFWSADVSFHYNVCMSPK